MPSADHYARAIIAASRETGEPWDLIVEDNPDVRFRHYVFHALLHVFPQADRTAIAAALRAPGKASYFYRSSLWHVLGDGPHRNGPIEWWDSGVLALTIKAIGNPDVPRLASTDAPLPPSRVKSGTPKPVLRQPVRQVEPSKGPTHGQPRTGLDRFADRYGRPSIGYAGGDDQIQGRERERRECRDLLAEAAANTAKLQAKLPKE